MKSIVTLVVFIFLQSLSVNAQSTFDKLLFEEAQEAYTMRNYKYCLQKIEELEQRGVKGLLVLHLKIVATNKIAEAHLNDEMIVQFKKDVKYYLKNYDNEDFINQYKDIYEISKTLNAPRWDEAKYCINRGDYLFKNRYFKEALDWYLKAEKYGSEDDKLYSTIGALFGFWLGNEVDAKKAFQYYLKAAEKGNVGAYHKLGYMYENGEGVEKDTNKAIEWYTKAAEKGNGVSQVNLANLYYNKQDYKNAFEWFNKRINNTEEGNPVGVKNRLGYMYENGEGVEKDINKAIEWYTKAAETNFSIAQYNLGRLYALGKGVEKDLDKAIEFLVKAVEGGYKNFFYLAKAYEEKGNYTEAYNYFQQGNETGKLGYYAYEGKVVEQNYTKAIEYWEMAAQKATIYNIGLAVAYFSGKGVQKDDAKALLLIKGVIEKYKDRDILKNYKGDREHSKKHYPNYSKDEYALFDWLAKEHNIVFEQPREAKNGNKE